MIDLLLEAGAAAVELDAGLPAGLLEALRPRLASRRDELPVWVVENVCPRRREGAAQLASRDREEARVALAAASETLELAAEVGAELVALELGEVGALRSAWPLVRRRFLRGELDTERLGDLGRERGALGAAHLDPARRALDHLGRLADQLGLRLGLRNPARYFALPSAPELRALLEDLAGAPLVPLWDTGAMALAAAFGVSPEETAAAWGRAPIIYLADACGPVSGLGAGQGELDLPRLLSRLEQPARAIYRPWSSLDAQEIITAAASLRALGAPAPVMGPTPVP